MFLNSIKPKAGSKRPAKRVGRGIGSGLGKTAGRGHKGQKSRAGGFHKVGFEGGQMPLQRRLPKRGFNSLHKSKSAEIRLSDLAKLAHSEIDRLVLVENGLIAPLVTKIKIINTGTLNQAIKVRGIKVTQAAKKAIEALGGLVEE